MATDDKERKRRPETTAIFGKALRIFLIASAPCLLLLSLIIPKKKGTIILIPRFQKGFHGNIKYFFLHMVENHSSYAEPYLLTKDKELWRDLTGKGLPALYFPSARAIFTLFRAQVVVVEDISWSKRLNGAGLVAFKAVKYQIWHGNGIKEVGMTNPNGQTGIEGPVERLAGKALNWDPVCDVMVFSSPSQEKTRAHSFRFRESFINGQPRNDILFDTVERAPDMWSDADAARRIKAAHDNGRHVILYSPTWRPKTYRQPPEAIDLDELDRFVGELNGIVVYKPHPKEKIDISRNKNVIIYDKDSDIYPFIRLSSCMITDYSSIYMDYLLLDRPIIFYPYDYERYMAERGVQRSYDKATPGPKCFSQKELRTALRDVLVDGADPWKSERQAILEEFNAYVDGRSCERLFAHIRRRCGF